MNIQSKNSQDASVSFSTHDEWRSFMEAHPILGDEYRNMRKMYDRLCEKTRTASQEKEWFSKEYQIVYGPSQYGHSVLFRRFGQLKAQLATEEQSMNDSLLLPVWTKLGPNSQVAGTTNPIRLLRFAFECDKKGIIGLRGQTEAVTQYILVRLMLSVDEVESEVDSGEDMELALELLLKTFFVPDASSTLFYAARLDKERKPVEIQTSTREPHTPEAGMHGGDLPCRFIQCNGGTQWVALDHRIKTDFMSVLKMVRKGKSTAEQYDRHGFTFVVEHERDADILGKEIHDTLQSCGCLIIESALEQPEGGVIDKDNPDTDPDFRARRLVFRIAGGTHGAVTVELNVQSLADKLIATVSYSPANHDRYTVRRFRAMYFPWRYPWFVYGIDWSEKSRDGQRIEAWLCVRQEWKT